MSKDKAKVTEPRPAARKRDASRDEAKNQPAGKHPGGRPSKYHTHVKPKLDRIKAETARGATREEIAALCGVTRSTIQEHAKQFSDLSGALRGADAEACALVEAALFRRAMGYSHNAVKIMSNGVGQGVIREEYIEHYPPDTHAAELFLTNLAPDRWKKKNHDGLAAELQEAWNDFIGPAVNDGFSDLPGARKKK